jgi:hypothetical protein
MHFEKVFPADLQMTRKCVRQAIPHTAIQTVQAVGNAGTAATAATVVGSAILQTVMSECLAQIWGMINGMQFIIHVPALNLCFPSTFSSSSIKSSWWHLFTSTTWNSAETSLHEQLIYYESELERSSESFWN